MHDTHHPIAGSLSYEDQRNEAARRARLFRQERLPKFLSYFERTLECNAAGAERARVRADVTHVDLAAFQVLAGMAYAFPNACARLAPEIPRLRALRDSVAARPRIAACLASERRLPFNESGISRHYQELDPE